MNEIREQDIQEAMRMSLISEEPSEHLVRELRVMASKVSPAKKKWWQPGLAIAGAVALTCGIAALMMTPSKATAHTYDSLVAAVGQANSFQLAIDSDDHGKQNHLSIAGLNGRFTIRTEEGALMQFDKGTMRIYDPKENKITQIKLGDIVDPQVIADGIQSGISEGLKQMDLKKMLKEYGQKYGKEHIKVSVITREAGKDVYHVTMDSPNETGRVLMLVDADTDLPERIDVQDKDSDDGSKHNSSIRMQFGSRVDPSTMVPDFPKNAQVVDVDLGAMIGGAMKGMGADMKDLKNIGPMIQESLKGLKSGNGHHVNIDLGSSKVN